MSAAPLTIAIVQIPLSGRSRQAAIASALKSAPTYRALAPKGLVRKDYLNGPAGGGGVYTWRSRSEAEAWYDGAWKARMTELFGVEPVVTYYECAVTVDNLSGETIVRDGRQEAAR
ncbi:MULTISPECIES: monooxygenase [Nitratireductor]|uniref:monooxygenase n=1 Tax=Nitratireductor TaxID=245876 RepID=UPI000D0CB759|nr:MULTISPECIES: monooxygenase [Nitratireductor]PSM17385.1 monooxygenase [Nitratireductor sp. StC3]